MSNTLLVFAKIPRPGHVKTRLTPVLTPEEAARLYRAFLRDALDVYADLPVDVRLYLAPPFTADDVQAVPDAISVHEQRGDGLGARMKKAFRDVLVDGGTRAVIVGTDHPTLPPAFVEQAFTTLEGDRTVCIGPSDDGGYYLLGMTAVYPQLFDGMHYSHDDVFADTLTRVGRTDARLTVLPPWYDVDTPTALQRLVDDLSTTDVAAPRTRTLIEDLDLDRLLQAE
ncbi:MAG: glycosyltransferase [Bacteroidetes bacterium SW_9_63_38]|nr:MAG: glycosyltransferase [Bacteroidetes bacterium SW_9_63_38]